MKTPCSISELGEAGVIEQLRRLFSGGTAGLVGIGDDMAVIPLPGAGFDLLLGSDATLQDVHFTMATDLRRVGHKALGRCLSDVAAMGGQPRWALLDLVLPPALERQALDQLLAGIHQLARDWQVEVVGGDTSQGNALQLHVFVAATAPGGRALLRSGARPGDRLYVTGQLGGSRAGKHLDFVPRIAEGQYVAGHATAAIDISDGLATDARHLADASNVSVFIEAARIPRSGAHVSVEAALCDGEDFELLFTVPAPAAAALESGWPGPAPLTCIGHIGDPGPGVWLIDAHGDRTPVPRSGYQHFGDIP